jgi:DNA-binding NarL/FixJ family response regulator
MNVKELTPRQTRVLRLVADGQSSREIADVLQISVRTVEVHRFNLMRRLRVSNVAQLIRHACTGNLLAWKPSSGSFKAKQG